MAYQVRSSSHLPMKSVSFNSARKTNHCQRIGMLLVLTTTNLNPLARIVHRYRVRVSKIGRTATRTSISATQLRMFTGSLGIKLRSPNQTRNTLIGTPDQATP